MGYCMRFSKVFDDCELLMDLVAPLGFDDDSLEQLELISDRRLTKYSRLCLLFVSFQNFNQV